jgi:hypothetical protein
LIYFNQYCRQYTAAVFNIREQNVYVKRIFISGKHAYREENRPSWWPEDLRFCSPNTTTAGIY